MSLHDDRLHRFSRLFVVYNMLAMGGRVTANDMAAACHCDPKTIRRDLRFLQETGAQYRWDARKKSYVLESPSPLLSVELSVPEILALALWREALPTETGLPYDASARSGFDKLAGRLPAALREELNAIRDVVSVEAGARHHYQQAPLQTLVEAARTSETVEMHYYTISRDVVTIREIDPYSLALRQGYMNLVAFCHQRRQVLLFSLDNIRGLRPTGQIFTKLPGFSLAKFLEGSVGMMRGEPIEIVVRFDASITRWAERYRWNFNPQLQREADGSLLLRGKVSGLEGIRTELLRWGSPVTVLEPAELREAILQEAQKIVEKYRPAPKK